MITHVILATHGSPPSDFPPREMGEFFALHAKLGHSHASEDGDAIRYRELEEKMRNWKRTEKNDPFYVSSLELATYMEKFLQMPVFPAFNEFCAPTVADALEASVEQGAGQLIVVSSMLTRGGEHAEVDIRQAVEQAQKAHAGVEFIFAFPFPGKDIARFLAEQVRHFTPQTSRNQ